MAHLCEPAAGTPASPPVWALQIADRFEVPAGIETFEDFRQWTRSDDFPDTGRIDWIEGRIEVDMLAENIFEHNTPKGELGYWFLHLVRHGVRGHVFSDRVRVVGPDAGLSCEPDVSFALAESVASGRVTFTPTADDRPDSYIEVVGAIDLVVEVLSDSSVAKDLHRLPAAYFATGVTEYWVLDARRGRCEFSIHHRGADAFEPVDVSNDGLQWSDVFGRAFRFTRQRGENGLPDFTLHVHPPVD